MFSFANNMHLNLHEEEVHMYGGSHIVSPRITGGPERGSTQVHKFN